MNLFKIILLLFTSTILLLNCSQPTENSKEWFIHYQYNNIEKLYIVDGKNIKDKTLTNTIQINDSINLFRDSIIEYRNLTPFGKQIVVSPSDRNNTYLNDFTKNYYQDKRDLVSKIKLKNIHNFIINKKPKKSK